MGRCDHTFLHHIVRHHGALDDVTVFVSGDGGDDRKGPKIRHVIRRAAHTGDTVLAGTVGDDVERTHADFALSQWLSSSPCNRVGLGGDDRLRPADVRPFGAWYAARFPELAGTGRVRVVVWLSVFAVHRRHIEQHGVGRYRILCAELEGHPHRARPQERMDGEGWG